MAKRLHKKAQDFTHFVTEPPVSVAIVAFALLSLLFAIFDFTEAAF